ncbi:MAG: lcfB 11 [Ilumatobacteraceae bacterium]|nr:lcfB 11 [Ilumatobacteraceae bacterium]MCU1389916.1 lcfB 11 [Ilumatobacteraceae bacterium]
MVTAGAIGLTEFRTRLERIAAADPDVVVAMRPDGTQLSSGQLLAAAQRVVNALGPAVAGRRVGLIATNTVEAVAALHGVWLAGASAVLIGPMTPPAESARRLAVTGCVARLDPGEPAVVTALASDHDVSTDGEAVVIFTSGTTGQAKAASIPFRSLESSARTVVRGLRIGSDGRDLATPPRSPQVVFVALAHMGGLLATQTSWSVGKPILFVPKFDATGAFDVIERFQMTTLALTPAMVFDLAHAPGERSIAPVKTVSCGTAPLPESTRLLFERRYGVPILRNYGQTEFTGAIAFERYDDVKAGRRPPLSVGRVADGVEVLIIGEAGVEMPHGEIGEIWARGGSSMSGYLGAADSPMTGRERQGWIATGDLGTLDGEGFVSIVGRSRDLMICGGFNVYPAVVEAAVNDVAGVLDCAVAGAPDDRLGEVPVVAIVTAPGATVELEPLRTELRSRLAAYELPRDMRVVAAIPRTPNGKVDRPAVVALFTS